MIRWLIRLVLSGAALYLTSVILSVVGTLISPSLPPLLAHTNQSHMIFHHDATRVALAVVGLCLVNSLVRPVIGFFGKPLTFLTLGVSSLVVNSILFWAVGYFTGGYDVGGVIGLIAGPIVMGCLNGALNMAVSD